MIKNTMLWLGYLIVTLLASAVATAEDCNGSITERQALAADDARTAAQTASDFGVMNKLLGDDLVYVHSSGAMDDKTRFIESMRSGTIRYRSMQRKNVKVRSYGCLAILSGDADIDATLRGQQQTLQVRFHAVYARRPAGPQLISWQSTRRQPAQSQ